MQSIVRSSVTEMGMYLKYGVLIYDVMIDLIDIIFGNFHNQQDCMIMGFN